MSKAKQADWRKVAPAPIVLAFGPEDYLISRVIRSIREQLRLLDSSLEVTEIEAADYSGGQLQDLSSPSLFASPRLIIIRGMERCSDELIADGVEYLGSVSPDSTVILTHSASSVRGKKLLDALRADSNVTEVSCLKIAKDAERTAFINAEFVAEGRQISAGAVRALEQAFSGDLAELASACSQLMQDSAAAINEELVDAYYGGRIETKSWEISDAALAGQSAKALSLVRHTLASGSDPVPIVSTISGAVRQLAKSFGNRSITATELGVPPWKLEQIRRNLNGWTDAGLANAINAVVEADSAAKGAHRDPVYVIEQLVLLISKKGLV